jgi:membrane associated rhomboid family serine protease
MSNNNEPPPPNPILSAYEGFVRDTPLVTRYTMTTLVMSWIVSFVADPTFALANIPHYTVLKFEIYRIALSPLVCTNLLTLIFAYISFLDNGKRLEFSLGSTKFAWLMLVLAVSANVAFLVLCFTLYLVTGGENGFLHLQASGIWTMLFALISIECCKAPATSQRRLFFLTVPTVYYPLVLFALFSLFGGFRLSYLLSIGIGYAYG